MVLSSVLPTGSGMSARSARPRVSAELSMGVVCGNGGPPESVEYPNLAWVGWPISGPRALSLRPST